MLALTQYSFRDEKEFHTCLLRQFEIIEADEGLCAFGFGLSIISDVHRSRL